MELERLKKEVSLLDYIGSDKVKRIGPNEYWVNPCPVCGHKDHFTIYGETNSYYSFSGCCQGGSIIDYFMDVENMSQGEAINKVKEMAGVEVDRPRQQQERPKKEEKKPEMTEEQKKEAFSTAEKAQNNLCEYYYNRGLTEKTIKKYGLGYLPEGHKKYGQAFKCMLPVSDNFIIYRKDHDQEDDRYRNEGGTEIFNTRYLQDPSLTEREIFITEGIFDALSLEELDRPSVALNSSSMSSNFIAAVTRNKEALQDKVFILAVDNDEAGKKAAQDIKKGLQEISLQVVELSFSGYKDVNEYLINDREGFAERLEGLHLSGSVAEYLAPIEGVFWQEIKKRAEESDIRTGITRLDHNLGGGLYPGLYVLGSVSSLGKTALALQLADRIAYQGFKVLFFSLEMATFEMVCRSLARTVFERTGGSKDISTGNFIKNTLEKPGDLFNNGEVLKAYENYVTYAGKNLNILQGNFDLDVHKIREQVEEYKALTGCRPVVFIDYLQVVRPLDMRLTEKQHIDLAIVELKRLSRDLDIPVFVVSSFNRMSYNTEVDMAAFKESGSIEYTADCILALQIRKGEEENINVVKNKEPRPLDLVLLKNRRGKAFDNIALDYWPKVNFFNEV